MKVVVFLIFLLVPPFYWGYSGKTIVAPVVGIVVLAIFAVTTGWRHINSGPVKSAVLGAAFASLAAFPAYLIGHWLA